MRSLILAALLPPGSIGAEVSLLQDSLFAGFGCASCLALPPLVPLGFLAGPPTGRAWDAAGRGLSHAMERRGGRGDGQGLRIRSGGLGWKAGHLWLAMDCGGVWTALRGELDIVDAPSDGPDLPAVEGFWLGCPEIAGDPVAAGKALGTAAPELHFTSCSLGILEVQCASGTVWWREVFWEVVREKPLRVKRPTGNGAAPGPP